MRVLDARYLGSGTSVTDLPGPALPEVAFAGRSNVGKSSLLNALVGRKGLARTSKTPGRTQTLNLFECRLEVPSGEMRLVLTDLPGYGYAARSKAARTSWGPMIEGYLLERPSLRALVLLVDARRGIQGEDEELVTFWAQTRKPLLTVATKIDKLPRSQQRALLAKLGASLGTSAETGDGIDALWRALVKTVAA